MKKPSEKKSVQPKVAGSSLPGFPVQISYRVPTAPSQYSPKEDALWFATYPIIPRVGDCVFRDGVYYRVEQVYLYENTTPSWCADLEVSYYGRQRS
ncbi:MAG: hypothetical protein HC873_16090 [Leptolyngbyaceae cyanobacterium SL_1_1]|nr:hypothetical protein [Leptolyngbyaceae cyanobacterium RM1_1_2]NJO10909.1 hypothetical protein [Leptolyngbyaceae cyanobacterium SL_1_1]